LRFSRRWLWRMASSGIKSYTTFHVWCIRFGRFAIQKVKLQLNISQMIANFQCHLHLILLPLLLLLPLYFQVTSSDLPNLNVDPTIYFHVFEHFVFWYLHSIAFLGTLLHLNSSQVRSPTAFYISAFPPTFPTSNWRIIPSLFCLPTPNNWAEKPHQLSMQLLVLFRVHLPRSKILVIINV
jgi:hypothetical protein